VTHPQEPHSGGNAGRLNWLRAAVLGANDGIVSVAGMPACLAAVSPDLVQTLVVPGDGLVRGYECGRCGTLSLDADTCCPDWGTAALPVPDVIEEMVSLVPEDGSNVLVAGGGWSQPCVRLP
jgi:hypothetical protein